MSWNEVGVLVEKARAGDRSAYGELVARFQPVVYALALARLRNPVDAQELAQEVFVHGMTKLDQLRQAEAFPGWIRRITARMAINRLSRRGRLRGADGDLIDSVQAHGPAPLEEMVRAEQRAELWEGLNRLKSLDRATLVAFYIRGRSLRQMSREFQTPVGTIKRRLHVARHRLRRQLERPPEPACI